jgi:membrane protease YdiL (CAAX protease family)
MNIRLDVDDVMRRLTLIARGLGFVFLTYFIPAFLRDVIGHELPGGGFVGAIRGDLAGPWIPLAVSLATFSISLLFVLVHARTGHGAADPAPLLPRGCRALTEWSGGFALGGIGASLAVIPGVLAGATVVHGWRTLPAPDPVAVLAVAAILVVEGAREELGFRGPAQRDLAHAVASWPAAIFLAGSFALIHRANPDATAAGLWGVLVAGFALAGVVRARGDLAMACGIHAGWNVFLGLVWSVPVSGHPLAQAMLRTSVADPRWTGGTFGPEGSVPGIVCLAAFAAVAWTRKSAASGAR